MSLYGGTRFKKATGAATPDFVGAEIGQANANASEKARINSLRSQNQSGAMGAYNKMMGDDAPIGDTVKGWMGMGEEAAASDVAAAEQASTTAETVDALRTGAEVVDISQGANAGVQAMQTAQQIQAAQQAAAAAEAAAAIQAAQTAAAASQAAATTASTASTASGPWGALAAAIYANENASYGAGRRDEDDVSYRTDLASGEVLEQDTAYYGDKMGGAGGEIISTGGQLSNPEGTLDIVKDLAGNIKTDPFDPFKLF